MKKVRITLLLVLTCCLVGVSPAQAQAKELAQLALNIEKLAQFKQILADLKAGYQILTGGYKVIRDLSEGNFSLHKTFLDGLKAVSPAVRKYYKIAAIIDAQLQLLKEYKAALSNARVSGQFRVEELDYLLSVYEKLTSESVEHLGDLLTVITESDLRMSDEERISAIDHIYESMTDKLHFLRAFNSSTQVLALQRAKAAGESRQVSKLYGLD